MSIDEIWSYQPEEANLDQVGDPAEEQAEETVVFDHSAENNETSPEAAFPAFDGTNTEPDSSASGGSGDVDYSPGTAAASSAADSSVVTDFELVGDSEGVDDTGEVDTELDDLEAEIARELED